MSGHERRRPILHTSSAASQCEPTVKGVTSYAYSFNYGQTQTIVPAHDGRASIKWTPAASGSYDIEVSAITADGTQLFPYDYYFNVN